MWRVFVVFFLILLMISLLPVGILVLYRDGEVEVHFTLWKKRFVLYPVIEKKTKSVKKTKRKKKRGVSSQKNRETQEKTEEKVEQPKVETSTESQQEKVTVETLTLKTQKPKKKPEVGFDPQLALIKDFLPVVLLLFQRLGQYKKIDQLELELVVGSSDPVEATMLYGKAHAVLGGIWLPLDQALNIQQGRARVRLDFENDGISVYGRLAMSITIGKIVYLLGHIGLQGYKVWKTGGENHG